MKVLLTAIVMSLLLVSIVIAYFSPSIFGHDSEVVGVSINGNLYSLQDLFDSNYLTEKNLPPSTIVDYSHSAEEITIRGIDGEVKLFSEALEDDYYIFCEDIADVSEDYEVLTNPGHSGYEVSLVLDGQETTLQDYFNSGRYCTQIDFIAKIPDCGWDGYKQLTNEGNGVVWLGCSSEKLTIITQEPSDEIPTYNQIFHFGVTSKIAEGKVHFSGSGGPADDCTWGTNSEILTDFFCSKAHPSTSETIESQDGNIACNWNGVLTYPGGTRFTCSNGAITSLS